jgi:hypothetical protein
MALRYTTKSFCTLLLWLCVLMIAASCEINYSSEVTSTDQKEKSIAEMSQEVCDCFSKQKGDIDTRLTPCVKSITHYQKINLPEGYSLQDSVAAVDDMKSKLDSMKSRDLEKISSMVQNLVISCDTYGSEFEALYDKWYPIDSSANNLVAIKQLSSEFQRIATSDNVSKEILHRLIAKNIEARRLEEGLRRCKQMKSLYRQEEGAYYASAFIYQLQKKYSLAIKELEQEIYIYKKPDLKLIVAVIKRKAQRDNDERQRNY